MKIFAVGGQVRDEIMGVDSKDRDYVVVGSTHEEMIAAGFVKVGASFPVYLHPETKEEYALARTERSTGPGYHDFETVFTPDVTIGDDLFRRDLTINAIAKDLETGEYIDPYQGIADIRDKKLKMVSSAAFNEDPLRIYRLARLYARYGGEFTIDPYTHYRLMVAKDNLVNLPAERKVAELMKCFSDKSPQNKPSLMIDLLTSNGEFPELENLKIVPQPAEHHPEGNAYVHTLLCMDYAKLLGLPPEAQWSVMCHDLGKVCFYKFGNLHGHEAFGVPIVENLCDRFGVPNTWRKMAKIMCEEHGRMHKVMEMKPRKVYDLIDRIRGEKDISFAHNFIMCCLSDARGRGPESLVKHYPQSALMFYAISTLAHNKAEISEGCKKIAEDFKGRPELIRDNVRSLKISYVRKAIWEIKNGALQK